MVRVLVRLPASPHRRPAYRGVSRAFAPRTVTRHPGGTSERGGVALDPGVPRMSTQSTGAGPRDPWR